MIDIKWFSYKNEIDENLLSPGLILRGGDQKSVLVYRYKLNIVQMILQMRIWSKWMAVPDVLYESPPT